MALSSLDFCFREAAVNVRRHGLMSLAAIGTITFALFIVGGCGITLLNLHQLAQGIAREISLTAWLNPRDTLRQAQTLRAQIQSLPGIKSARIITRDETFREEKKHFGDHRAFAEMENPFGHAVYVEPKDPRQVPVLARAIRAFPNVASVEYGEQLTQRLLAIIRWMNWIIAIVGTVLIIGAAAIVHNTVRITLFARRREIGIMQVVGATNWFVSGPFLLEGAFHGLIGAGLGAVLLLLAYHYGRDWLSHHLVFLAPVLSERALLLPLLMLVGIGMFLGLTGSAFSIRRFLKHGLAH